VSREHIHVKLPPAVYMEIKAFCDASFDTRATIKNLRVELERDIDRLLNERWYGKVDERFEQMIGQVRIDYDAVEEAGRAIAPALEAEIGVPVDPDLGF